MKIALELKTLNGPGGQADTVTFDESGGSIGRRADTDCPLHDPESYISSVHARIEHREGRFVLIDQSTNGTYLNDRNNKVAKEEPYPLASGDQIYIGHYMLTVTILLKSDRPASFLDELAEDEPAAAEPGDKAIGEKTSAPDGSWGAPAQPADELGLGPGAPGAGGLGAELPDDDWLASPPATPEQGLFNDKPTPALGADELLKSDNSLLQESGEQDDGDDWWKEPSVQSPAINENIAIPNVVDSAPPAQPEPVAEPEPEPSQPEPSQPEPLQAESPAQATAVPNRPAQEAAPQPGAGVSGGQARAFVDALGLAGLSEEELDRIMPELGQMLGDCLNRLISILRSRDQIKSEMSVNRTGLMHAENNPLKLSPDAATALELLFIKHTSAFLEAGDSIHQSFNDLEDHQAGLLAGVRRGYEGMLQQLSPERIKSRSKESALLKVIPGGEKARFWDAYETLFEELMNDRNQAYDRLFGEQFTKGYNDHVSSMTISRKAKRSD